VGRSDRDRFIGPATSRVRGIVWSDLGRRLGLSPGQQRVVGSGCVVGDGGGHGQGHQERRGILADGIRDSPPVGRAAAERR